MGGGVSFDEEQQQSASFVPTSPKKGMAGWLVAQGIAKNTTRANVYLLIIAALAFAASIYFFLS